MNFPDVQMRIRIDYLHLVEGEAKVFLFVDEELLDGEVVFAREFSDFREELEPLRNVLFVDLFLLNKIVHSLGVSEHRDFSVVLGAVYSVCDEFVLDEGFVAEGGVMGHYNLLPNTNEIWCVGLAVPLCLVLFDQRVRVGHLSPQEGRL